MSLVYTGSTVVLQVVIGLALALLVMDMKRGQGWFRIIAILPVVLSPAVVGMIWRTFMLAPEFGIVDFLAINAGLGSKNWLGDPLLAMVSVIAIHTWQWTPFAFMVLLASLAALPEDIYEAARLDRATAWQRFRRITLPLLRPAIVMVIIMRTMVALTAFAAIFTVTGGRPGHRDGDPQSLCLPQILHGALDRLRRGARGRAADRHHRHLGRAVRDAEGEMSAKAHPLPRAAGDLAGVPARLGVPDRLERAELAEDRAGCAGLSAEADLLADAGRLSRRAVRLGVDPAEPRSPAW